MNNEDFKIIELPNGTWAVSWPEWKPVRDMVTALKLFDMVRTVNTSVEVGFGIELVSTKETKDFEIMWVKDYMLQNEQTEYYADWLTTMYNVVGVVFFEESEARALKYELDKKLTWHILRREQLD